ncbi:gliding motility-associated C-terminal domain-containing protein [Vicingaceae bacterium]|nr:gliding motility-associated C-terminal domain-containing protein [Vicingaceae bacterium]
MLFTNKKIVLKSVLTFLLLTNALFVNAQCFEIESILIDACGPGSLEGENEMIRFKVGPTPLNSNNITANFPTANSFLGICMNGASAAATTSLNATITGCGFLIEPAGGVLPANANVLFLTSTDVDVNANSFANLNDTLYIIFQCAGNTSGHFGNNSAGIKTFSMTFSSPSGCTDDVSWQNSNLVGGNGALVNFDPAGNSTFTNNGCQAPFNPIDIIADIYSNSSLTICPGDSLNIYSTSIGAIQSIIWTGGTGSFNNPNSDTTTYYSSANDNSAFQLFIGGITSCNDTIFDTLNVNVSTPTSVSILEGDTVTICSGTSINLNGTGTSNYLWNTGETSSSINASTQAYYYLTDTSNICTSDTAFIQVNTSSIINVSLTETGPINLCQGESITLHANGADNYIWNTSATTDSISVNTSGTYFVYGIDICPSDTDSVVINIVLPSSVDINEGSFANICSGNDFTLHTSGNSSVYNWNNGSTFDSLTINTTGQYWVTASNGVCPSISDTITISEHTLPSATIIGDTNFCSSTSINLLANGTGSFTWSNNTSGNTTTISTAQTITLTASNICGTTSIDTQIITEEDCNINTEIIIPNVFTPNNDDFNDIFTIQGINITSVNGKIFNRWGQLVYEWNDIDSGWDGKNKASGTYFYIINVAFLSEETQEYKGTVTLLK